MDDVPASDRETSPGLAPGGFEPLPHVGRETKEADTHVESFGEVPSDAGSTPAASTIRLAPQPAFGGPKGSLMAGPEIPLRRGHCWENALSEAYRSGESKGCTTSSAHSRQAHRRHVIVVVIAFVYILRCSDGSLYIGATTDLEWRVARHNEGRASAFTAMRRPVRLVFYEMFPNIAQAVARERQLKGWTKAKKEALVAGDLIQLKRL